MNSFSLAETPRIDSSDDFYQFHFTIDNKLTTQNLSLCVIKSPSHINNGRGYKCFIF